MVGGKSLYWTIGLALSLLVGGGLSAHADESCWRFGWFRPLDVSPQVDRLRTLLANQPHQPELLIGVLDPNNPRRMRKKAWKALKKVDLEKSVSDYQLERLVHRLMKVRYDAQIGNLALYRNGQEKLLKDMILMRYEEQLTLERLKSDLSVSRRDDTRLEKALRLARRYEWLNELLQSVLLNVPMVEGKVPLPFYLPKIELLPSKVANNDIVIDGPLKDFADVLMKEHRRSAQFDYHWQLFRQNYMVVVASQIAFLMYQQYYAIQERREKAKEEFMEEIRQQAERARSESVEELHDKLLEGLRRRAAQGDEEAKRLIEKLEKAYRDFRKESAAESAKLDEARDRATTER